MAVEVTDKIKMYDAPEKGTLDESYGLPLQNPLAPNSWYWQQIATILNALRAEFTQIKGVAVSGTNPVSPKVGDIWFYSTEGSYPYFGTPVTKGEVGYFVKGASNWTKNIIVDITSYEFSKVKGSAVSSTNPGASEEGDIYFYSTKGTYPYFGTPVTRQNEIGFFKKGASSWDKVPFATLFTYGMQDGETGISLETILDDISAYSSTTTKFKVRGESLKDASVQLSSFSQAVLDYIGSGGAVTNQPDERHLDKFTEGTEKLRIKDGFEGKTYLYNPSQYATAADIKTAVEALVAGGDKHLVISDNVDGGGLTWNIPSNVKMSILSEVSNINLDYTNGSGGTLDIEGKIIGASIIWNDTYIPFKYHQIFENCTFEVAVGANRAYRVDYITPYMFGLVNDFDKTTYTGTDNFAMLQNLADFVNLTTEKTNILSYTEHYGTSEPIHMHNFRWQGLGTTLSPMGTCTATLVCAKNIDREGESGHLKLAAREDLIISDSSTLTVDAIYNDIYATVTDGAKFKKGNYVLLSSEQSLVNNEDGVTDNRRRGEIKKILEVEENVLIFTESIRQKGGYRYDMSGTVYLMNDVSIELNGINFYGQGDDADNFNGLFEPDSGQSAIQMVGCVDSRIENCTVENFTTAGITPIYCKNLYINNLTGEQGKGVSSTTNTGAYGYTLALYSANSNIYIHNYTGKWNRHAFDANHLSWMKGRLWDCIFTDSVVSGTSAYDNQSIIAPHKGMGSIVFKNITIIGMNYSAVKGSSPYALGDVQYSEDKDVDPLFRHYEYINASGTGLEPVTDTNSWRKTFSSNSILDEAFVAGSPKIRYNKYTWRGEAYNFDHWGTDYTTPPSDNQLYKKYVERAQSGFQIRGEVQDVWIEDCKVIGCKNAFGWENDVNVSRFLNNTVINCYSAFNNLVANEFTIEKLKVVNSNALFELRATDDMSKHKTITFDGLEMVNSRYLTGSTYLPPLLERIVFKRSTFRDYYGEDIVDIYDSRYVLNKDASGSNFKELVYDDIVFRNNVVSFLAVKNNSQGNSDITIKNIKHEFDSNVNQRMSIRIDDTDVLTVENADFDYSVDGDYRANTELIKEIDGIASVEIGNLNLKRNKARLNNGAVSANISVSEFRNFDNDIDNLSVSSKIEVNKEIINAKGDIKATFGNYDPVITTPLNNISAYKDTILKDENGVVWIQKDAGYVNTGWQVEPKVGYDSDLTEYSLDIRKYNLFRKTVDATTFTLNVSGFALNQVIIFRIRIPSGGAASLPATLFDLSDGTLTNFIDPPTKAHAYSSAGDTIIDGELTITGVSAGVVTSAELSHTVTSFV